jgi:hypothetical protein
VAGKRGFPRNLGDPDVSAKVVALSELTEARRDERWEVRAAHCTGEAGEPT